jgi:glycosyltransferase involved in cell wall biosynthesis
MTVLVSVLLPTYRRPHHLPLTLAALAQQDADLAWELVVVDNDPTGSARLQVDRARPGFAVEVRYVVEPTRGAAAARNRGMAEARGQVAAMIDDDVLPRPDWLRHLVGPLLDGTADGSGGRVLLDPSVATPRWFEQDLLGGLLSHFDPAPQLRPLVGREFLVTANAAFVLQALRDVGGFDPALGPQGGRHMVNDDLQVVRDLSREGARLVYVPAAVVQHELPAERLELRWLLRRAWWQGRSDWLLDQAEHRQRFLNGSRVAVTYGAATVRNRVRTLPWGAPLAARLACDLAVMGGALAEAASWSREPSVPAGDTAWESRPAGPRSITVLLPTYRRPESLPRLLASLAGQGPDLDWELLVVDNDPAGSALAAVRAASRSFEVPVRYVVEARQGAAHARNRGIAEARGAITVMVDDDVVVSSGWLAALVAPVVAGTADATGGRVELDPAPSRPAWFSDALVGGYVAQLDLGPVARPLEGREIVLTANAAFRTDLLREVGGFDGRLGPSGARQIVHDDTQLMRAVQAAAGRVSWAPSATVVHDLAPSRLRRRWVLQRAFWQGRSDWLLDRTTYSGRRLNGSRVALAYWRVHVTEQWAMPLPAAARRFAVVSSTARLVGAVTEAASWDAARPDLAAGDLAAQRGGVEV